MSGVNFVAALILPLILIAPLHTNNNKYKTIKACKNVTYIYPIWSQKRTYTIWHSPHKSNLRIHFSRGYLNEIIIRKRKGSIRLPTFIWTYIPPTINDRQFINLFVWTLMLHLVGRSKIKPELMKFAPLKNSWFPIQQTKKEHNVHRSLHCNYKSIFPILFCSQIFISQQTAKSWILKKAAYITLTTVVTSNKSKWSDMKIIKQPK